MSSESTYSQYTILDNLHVANQALSHERHETMVSHESNSFRDKLPKAGPSSLLRRSIVQRQCTICKKFRCPLKSHQAFVRHLRARGNCVLVHQLAEEKVDPFAKHPIVITPDYERLYAQGWQRWNSDFKGPERHLFPHSRYSAVFRNAWHDVALHYGMLSLLATQVSMLHSGVVDETALELQGKAISAQSRAIHHDHLSDARVMTALCIMSMRLRRTRRKISPFTWR